MELRPTLAAALSRAQAAHALLQQGSPDAPTALAQAADTFADLAALLPQERRNLWRSSVLQSLALRMAAGETQLAQGYALRLLDDPRADRAVRTAAHRVLPRWAQAA